MSVRTVLGKFHSESVSLSAGQAKVLNGTGTDRPTTRLSLTLISTSAIYLGGQDVNAGNGLPWPANTAFALDCMDGLFAYSASAAAVSILEGF